MPMPEWHVQAQDDDGLFRTVENGTHARLSTAYWHYTEVAEGEAVTLLLRGNHIIQRSDDVELADRPADALL